jgi:xanthine dehydrogenase accessory factor
MLKSTTPSPFEPRSAEMTDRSETILRFACAAVAAGFDCVLATLVDIRGGAARALGTQMAIREDGLYCGYVSGGCIEQALAAETLETFRTGRDRFILFGAGSTYFDLQLPCGGGLTIHLHRLRSPHVLEEALERLAIRQRVSLSIDPSNEAMTIDSKDGGTHWTDGRFVRLYVPLTRIVFWGRSIELDVTAKIAEAAGYEAIIIDPLFSDYHRIESCDEDTAIVLLHHEVDREIPFLAAALNSSAFYIGALGSHKSQLRRISELRGRGVSDDLISRIKAPIGIFPKGRDASSIALSVLADIAAITTKRGLEAT